MKVELHFWEGFDLVTKTFQTVEEALLYYRKFRYKAPCKEKTYQLNWFGGEYRFTIDNGWSEWKRI